MSNDAGESTVEQRCAAADHEAMIIRPGDWAAASHCKLAKLITPAIKREDVVHEGAASNFETSLESLKGHVSAQKARIAAFLSSQD